MFEIVNVFLLLKLNKNENIINVGYWVLSENGKINSKQENQSVLIAKICSRKIQKNRKPAKKKKTTKISCHTLFSI